MKITNQKQAKAVIVSKLTKIAKETAIVKELCKKWYPDATITAGTIGALSASSISMRIQIQGFPE